MYFAVKEYVHLFFFFFTLYILMNHLKMQKKIEVIR